MSLHNWAGNVAYGAERLHRPTAVEQLQELVAGSRRIRALGSGHSFSRVADTDGDLVTLSGLPTRFEVADDRRSVTVSGGLRYGEVAPRLHAAGLALHNLGSLPHICVAGAVATGTHGSGDALGCLATAVLGLDLVTASGDLVHLDRTDPRLPGSVVALGALGVVTAVTLAVEPAYDVTQQVVDGVTPGMVRTNLDEVFAAGDSVSAFATWGHGDPVRLWVKRRADRARPPLDDDWLGGAARHPRAAPRARCRRGGVHRAAGPPRSVARAPAALPPRPHAEPRRRAADRVPRAARARRRRARCGRRCCRPDRAAAHGLRAAHGGRRRPLAQPGVRPRQPRGALHLARRSRRRRCPCVTALEGALAPFDARPHWGKVFTTDAGAVAALYPRHDDARALRRDLDPDDVFGNAFLDTYLPR